MIRNGPPQASQQAPAAQLEAAHRRARAAVAAAEAALLLSVPLTSSGALLAVWLRDPGAIAGELVAAVVVLALVAVVVYRRAVRTSFSVTIP